jgi:glycosyltransferase involved in cell wall biosynthesis
LIPRIYPGACTIKILAGQRRSANQYWAGKNWAGTQAVEVATGDFLLFIDADVRLKPGALETATATAETEKIDLFTCMPALRKRVFCRVVSAADNVQSLSSLLRLYRR